MTDNFLKDLIKQILINNDFCDNGLLDNCVEELTELFEEISQEIEEDGRSI